MTCCSLCGDEKPLGPNGVCEWAAGCDHRRAQVQADQDRFDADYTYWFVPLDCGHTRGDHAEQWHAIWVQDD